MGPLIILFGTRGVTSTAAEGAFHCPSCNGHAYRQRRVRRFFTLYFIPLIPLDVVGEYVECTTCNGQFDPQVLTYDPAAADAEFDAAFEEAVRRVMVSMLLADAPPSRQAVEAVRQRYGQMFGREVTEAQVSDEMELARQDGRSIGAYAETIAPSLTAEGKETVLRAAADVAAATGRLSPTAEASLAELGGALGMSSAHYNGVLQEALGGGPSTGATG